MNLMLGPATAAAFQGQQLLLDQQEKIADIGMRKQQAESMRMSNLMQQQQLQDKQALQQFMSSQQATAEAPAKNAVELAQMYTKGSAFSLSRGDYDGAAAMEKLAKGEMEVAQKEQSVQEKAKVDDAEALSTAAQDVSTNPTPENHKALYNAAIKNGIDPSKIPMPGTPGYEAFANQAALAPLKGEKRLEFLNKVSEERAKAKALKEQQDAVHIEKDNAAKATAQAREGMLAVQKEGLALREFLARSTAAARTEREADSKQLHQFNETEKLNKTLQTEAKPFLEDKHRLDKIEGLLEVNSSAADQQAHQALTAALGEFKGRATNLFYKDNKNFGSATSRITGFLSHAFAGRFQESDRAMIRDMVQDMKTNSIEPALTKLEQQQKDHAKGYGLDPDKVEIEGDFKRGAGKAKGNSYTEGQTATGADGVKWTFINGKWTKQ